MGNGEAAPTVTTTLGATGNKPALCADCDRIAKAAELLTAGVLGTA